METLKHGAREESDACLGSLAVKRVLGKDESPGSNPGLGLDLLRCAQSLGKSCTITRTRSVLVGSQKFTISGDKSAPHSR